MALVAAVGDQGGHSLRVLALTRYGRKGASSRVRFEQFMPELEAVGINVQLAPLLRDEYLERLYARQGKSFRQIAVDYASRLALLLRVRQFDLLWIEKELFPDLPAWFEQILGYIGVTYVVDFDDAIFHNYDLSANPWRRLLAKKIDKVMQGAALVVCGNQYLADRAVAAGANRVEVIPTVIDLKRYTVRSSASGETLVVGWAGSAATVKYLDMATPALKALTAEYSVQLRVIGADFSAPGIDVDCRQWKENDEVRQIQEFDIGIMPLTDSPWERGKCGYKLIQYMACGVPVIASPVGVNATIVEDGVSGYLASNQKAWLDAFRGLASDSGRRVAFGTRGRKLVEEYYCLQVTAPRLAALFKVVGVVKGAH